MTPSDKCPTCDLIRYLGELLTWDAEGTALWAGWPDDNESDPPGHEEHWGNRPAGSDFRIETDLLDSEKFVRAARMLTCALHPGHVLHIPGRLDDGTVGPACGASPMGAAVSGLIYPIGEGDAAEPGILNPMQAMHPHVNCIHCGDALVAWHLGETLGEAQIQSMCRWQSWLQGDRREPLAAGCSVRVAANGPGVLAFRRD